MLLPQLLAFTQLGLDSTTLLLLQGLELRLLRAQILDTVIQPLTVETWAIAESSRVVLVKTRHMIRFGFKLHQTHVLVAQP